jgi:hypothetical protein
MEQCRLSLADSPIFASKWIEAQVVLGSPAAACAGLGICHISTVGRLKSSIRCPILPVHIALTSSGRLRMLFHRSFITHAAYQSQFEGGRFCIQSPYVVPIALARRLGLQGTYTIYPGIVEVHALDDKRYVDV